MHNTNTFKSSFHVYNRYYTHIGSFAYMQNLHLMLLHKDKSNQVKFTWMVHIHIWINKLLIFYISDAFY